MILRFLITLIPIMTVLEMNAQNGPRNNMTNFPEAVPTNAGVEMVVQRKEQLKAVYVPDVVYKHKDGEDLKLQIFLPDPKDRKGARYPTIVFVKGSAWMKQNVYKDTPQISQFARRGYVVAVVEYRHSGIAPFPAQREDAIDAYKFMVDNADKYSVDTKNMFVWGDSSGGHIALFTGLKMGQQDTLPDINGIIAFYPPSNLLVMKDDPTAATTGDAKSPEGLLMGGVGVDQAPEKARMISPYFYFSKGMEYPPLLLAHGTKDRVVPFSQSDMLANKLKQEGIDYQFYALRDADHGSWEFWTPEMYDKVEHFIKKNIR